MIWKHRVAVLTGAHGDFTSWQYNDRRCDGAKSLTQSLVDIYPSAQYSNMYALNWHTLRRCATLTYQCNTQQKVRLSKRSFSSVRNVQVSVTDQFVLVVWPLFCAWQHPLLFFRLRCAGGLAQLGRALLRINSCQMEWPVLSACSCHSWPGGVRGSALCSPRQDSGKLSQSQRVRSS